MMPDHSMSKRQAVRRHRDLRSFGTKSNASGGHSGHTDIFGVNEGLVDSNVFYSTREGRAIKRMPKRLPEYSARFRRHVSSWSHYCGGRGAALWARPLTDELARS